MSEFNSCKLARGKRLKDWISNRKKGCIYECVNTRNYPESVDFIRINKNYDGYSFIHVRKYYISSDASEWQLGRKEFIIKEQSGFDSLDSLFDTLEMHETIYRFERVKFNV